MAAHALVENNTAAAAGAVLFFNKPRRGAAHLRGMLRTGPARRVACPPWLSSVQCPPTLPHSFEVGNFATFGIVICNGPRTTHANRFGQLNTSTDAHGEAPAEGSGEERTAPADPAGGGTGKRRVRGEADAAGGAAKKKPPSVCPHQRERSKCKECGGLGICPHQRIRSQCKECGGASICQHQRRRSQCKECGGAGICQQRERSRCKDCGGAGICQHQRRRSRCKECGGAGIC
jgi:hypothetical protein